MSTSSYGGNKGKKKEWEDNGSIGTISERGRGRGRGRGGGRGSNRYNNIGSGRKNSSSSNSGVVAPKRNKKSVQNRIRDLQRLLKKQNMPATAVREKERELESLQTLLTVNAQKEKEKQHMHKYKMVRFFERQKAARKIVQLEKQLANTSTDEDMSNLRSELKTWQQRVNYTLHFPKDRKYISLFPSVPITDEAVLSEQLSILEAISNGIDNGTLVQKSTDDLISSLKSDNMHGYTKSAEDGIKSSDSDPGDCDDFFMATEESNNVKVK